MKNNNHPHIVWLDKATLPGDIQRPEFAHRWTEHVWTAPDMIAERIEDASIVVTNKVSLAAEQLRSAKNLRRIVVAATGIDHIDQQACKVYDIDVVNVPAYGAESVAEHAICLMLALQRHLAFYTAAATNGQWSSSPVFCLHGPRIADLSGKTLAVVGAGAIGGAVARLGSAFGMQVIFSARRGQPPKQGEVSLGDAIAMADVLSLHIPLTEDTHHLISEKQLRMMKRSAILINTARGGLVDTQALAQALREKRIAGAGL
ncbi:MAG: hypothetical protein HC858_09720, partial [Brachymonas sp.]|nr:hypothetical protein [Brachymonas sp.]